MNGKASISDSKNVSALVTEDGSIAIGDMRLWKLVTVVESGDIGGWNMGSAFACHVVAVERADAFAVEQAAASAVKMAAAFVAQTLTSAAGLDVIAVWAWIKYVCTGQCCCWICIICWVSIGCVKVAVGPRVVQMVE